MPFELDRGPVAIHGTTLGWAAAFAAQLEARAPAGEVIAIVAADDITAAELVHNLRFFLGDPAAELDPIASLPGIDVSPYAELSPDRTAIVERIATIYRLMIPELRPRVVVTSAEALARRTFEPAELAARGTQIAKGDMIERDAFAAQLVASGWARVPVVDEPGTFAIRGGVVDIFAPLGRHPVRLELFGDEVETLRTFEPESQRTLRPVERIHIHPVRETIATGTSDVRTRLRAYAEEIAFPSKATRRAIEQLETGELFVGIEQFTPAYHDAMPSPAAAFPATTRWIVWDPDACRRAIADLHADADAQFAKRIDKRDFAYPPARHLCAADEVAAFASPRRIELPNLEVHVPGDPLTHHRLAIDPLRTLRQELDHARTFDDANHAAPLLRVVGEWLRDGLAVAIAADSQNRADRLHGILAQRGLAVRTAELGERPGTRPHEITIFRAAPTQSFRAPDLAVITASDIFGERVHHANTKAAKRAKDALMGGVSDFGQLAAGDYLVHQKHGVARYQGLKKIAVANGTIDLDTLMLLYDGGTLYLPVYRLGEVQRYVGAEGHAPRLDKLGGVTWEVTRTKVARHVRALAEELLQLYAQRKAIPGHAFPGADDTYRELEATFPFDETPDQLGAIEAVLADMERPRAMDRLVCGDVGYGKTEVAMRAVFRCVQGGKQAAILAPTTVLVEQHYRTMVERYKGFPMNIARLSRFQSKKEQIDTVKKLAEGGVDVVIGTHRLLSADVRWKDLGLLVIDEEQRFGVAHKERIKKTRTTVDCLTLTATPIPRTLHLAMAHLRDLSIIATPPADRRAVRTFVSRVDDLVIREAIERELARNGQIFFITPTIGTAGIRQADPRLPNDDRPAQPRRQRDDDRAIAEWAEYLKALVPKARIGIGHGSLSAEELEKVMLDFVQGQTDILIATTIVESGLDIPRANTMFVARADAFGLAQLYQLRGRIGRSKERAYCYLLVPEPSFITEDARRRLEALQRFTELGAGFQIASQDLEIRGGGELLGAKQSGSIAAVGFDQYVKMLEAAVAELDGKPIHSAIDPELQIETPGFIPDDYIPDPGQRLELYKRLSAVDNDDELAQVVAEIADRYGPVPADVVLLGELMGVKAIARAAGVIALEITSARVAIAVPADSRLGRAVAGDRTWKRLPDGRFATSPTTEGPAGARQALLAALGRAT